MLTAKDNKKLQDAEKIPVETTNYFKINYETIPKFKVLIRDKVQLLENEVEHLKKKGKK